MPFGEVVVYICVQLLSGVLAGMLFHAFLSGHGQAPITIGPNLPFTWVEAFIVEALYTCMLCFVSLNVVTAKKHRGNEFYGLAIGFSMVAGGYACGQISGGAFNPAIAVGIDMSAGAFDRNLSFMTESFLYLIYELLGAALAAFLFRLVRPDEYIDGVDEGYREYSLSTVLIAEFIGTFYLCLTVGLCVLCKCPATAWAAASALMSMIFAVGNVSGAHFNPAVSLALVLRSGGVFPADRAGPYMLVQLCASVVAALVCKAARLGGTYGFGPSLNSSNPYGWGAISIAEVVYTFVLCFVVLFVCTGDYPLKEYYGLAIGSCVTAGGFAIGSVSGGALNPALAFGTTIVHLCNDGVLMNGLAFCSLEFLGSALAATAFRVTYSKEF
jgi:aquaporin Z